MPSGTPTSAATTKPPTTRQTVMPMSMWKSCAATRFQPVTTVCQGSRRNSGVTQPPQVAAPQSPTNSTKNAMPRAIFAPRPTGTSGVNMALPSSQRKTGRAIAFARPALPARLFRRLLHEARIDDGVEIDLRLDHAALEQHFLRLLEEGLDLAAEELLVRRLVLPAQIGLRLLERGRVLLHRRAHDAEGFLR